MKNIQRFVPIKYDDYFPHFHSVKCWHFWWHWGGNTVQGAKYELSQICFKYFSTMRNKQSGKYISFCYISHDHQNINCNLSKMPNCYHSCVFHFTTVRSWCKDGFWPICHSGIIEDEFHFLFHCPKYSTPREKFYNQIQQNFADFNQLSYKELITKLMNSQNFSVNSHLLKFVSLCNDLHTNLLSNDADDTW